VAAAVKNGGRDAFGVDAVLDGVAVNEESIGDFVAGGEATDAVDVDGVGAEFEKPAVEQEFDFVFAHAFDGFLIVDTIGVVLGEDFLNKSPVRRGGCFVDWRNVSEPQSG